MITCVSHISAGALSGEKNCNICATVLHSLSCTGFFVLCWTTVMLPCCQPLSILTCYFQPHPLYITCSSQTYAALLDKLIDVLESAQQHPATQPIHSIHPQRASVPCLHVCVSILIPIIVTVTGSGSQSRDW